MNTELAPAGISAEDWRATPAAVRALVLTLLSSVAQQQQRVAELEERLNQNSCNSSKPPSADAPNAPARPQRSASGRKAGGQPGHAGHSRPLKPLEQVQQVVPLRPSSCRVCGTLLLGGEQQMLAIARGLMLRPRLLMLDEPSLGIAPLLVDEIFRALKVINAADTTILLVEQNVREALQLADWGYVLQTGRVIHAGPASELLNSDIVRQAYLGL